MSLFLPKSMKSIIIALLFFVPVVAVSVMPGHAAAITCKPNYTLVEGKCVPAAAGSAPVTYPDHPSTKCSEKPTFFGLVPWYQYLTLTSDGEGGCKITNFDSTETTDSKGNTVEQDHVLGRTSPILLIILAILDDLLRVAGLVAVGFVIFGGFEYMTSQGSPDSTKKAQQTIINALVGLVIALIAVGLVSYLGHTLGS